MANEYNPILWVQAYTGQAITDSDTPPTGAVTVACPSTYQYGLQDISQADAGRTEDTTMHTLRLGQTVKLQLAWQNIQSNVVSSVLQAFNSEYIIVRYLDAYFGTYRSSVFYVGDRSAPLYNSRLGIWSSVSFNIIERTGWNV